MMQRRRAPRLAAAGAGLARLVTAPAFWIALLRRPRSGAAKRAWARRVRPPLVVLAIGVFLSAIVFAITMAGIDAAAMTWRRGFGESTIRVFDIVTDFGLSGWLLIPTGTLLFIVATAKSPALGNITRLVLIALTVRLGFVFLAIGLPGLVVAIGKRVIGRLRPSELGPFIFEPLSWRAAYASLPSGHTTTAFAALIAIGSVWPRARPFLVVYAVAIGASRFVVNAHFPSDVLAGALFGAFGAWLVREWYAMRGLGFLAGSDGRVHARPGPSFARLKRVAREAIGQ